MARDLQAGNRVRHLLCVGDVGILSGCVRFGFSSSITPSAYAFTTPRATISQHQPIIDGSLVAKSNYAPPREELIRN